MKWRGPARRAIPYLVAAAGGFFLSYVIVAFAIFPATLIPSDVAIPNVVGLSYADASKRLQAAGLVAARGEARFHVDAPSGSVLAQNPAAGGMGPKGSEVLLEVSRGQRQVEVPTVMGMTREQAEQVIASAGLLLGEVTEQRAPLPRGQVLESRPTAGERVPIPSAVELVVSTGPETVQVPEVVGEGYAEARTLLGQLGLRVGDVAVDPSSSLPANTVVAQTPAAGRAVEGGAAVSLTISGREP